MAENTRKKLASLWAKKITKKDGTPLTIATGEIEVNGIKVRAVMYKNNKTKDTQPDYVIFEDNYSQNREATNVATVAKSVVKPVPVKRPTSQPVQNDDGLL